MKPIGLGRWKGTSGYKGIEATKACRKENSLLEVMDQAIEYLYRKYFLKPHDLQSLKERLLAAKSMVVYLNSVQNKYLVVANRDNIILIINLLKMTEVEKVALQEMLNDRKIEKIFYHSKDTLRLLSDIGITIKGYCFDILLAHQVLTNETSVKVNDINKLIRRYQNKSISRRKTDGKLTEENSIKQNIKTLFALRDRLELLLKEHRLMETAVLEFQCIPAIIKLEQDGILFDFNKWSRIQTGDNKAIVDRLYKHLNKKTGRLHANYHQIGTVTGRITCSEPNLQGMPRIKEIRECFVPEKGNRYIIADYSQIELRVAAEISHDKAMIEAFRQGKDLHRLTASIIANKDENKVTVEERQAAKAINFGLIYSMGNVGLKAYAFKSYGVQLTERQVMEFKYRFFQQYNGLARWQNNLYEGTNHVSRTLLGRRRTWEQRPKLTEMYNYPIQGTAADIMKTALAMLARYKELKIVCTVHDEVLIEVPEQKAEEFKVLVEDILVQAAKRYLKKVPVEVELNICKSWADKK